jgi:hypothetical protein
MKEICRILGAHRRALLALSIGSVLVALVVHRLDAQRRGPAVASGVPTAQLYYVSRVPLSEWELDGSVAEGDLAKVILRHKETKLPPAQLLKAVHGQRDYRVEDFDQLSGPHLIKVAVQENGDVQLSAAPERIVMMPIHRYVVPLLIKSERSTPGMLQVQVATRSYELPLPPQSVRGYCVNLRADEVGTSLTKIAVKFGEQQKEASLTLDVRPAVTLKVRLTDTGNEPAAARIYLFGSDGLAHSPNGGLARMTLGGEYFFYAAREFEVVLPEGAAAVEAVRGIEYSPVRREVAVRSDGTPEIEIRLEPRLPIHRKDWYSADAHIHANYVNNESVELEDIRLQILGEGLDNANLMVANSYSAVVHDLRFFEGKPNRASQGRTVLYWNEEMRNRSLYGHMAFFNLKQLVYPLFTGFPGTPNFEDYPPNHHQAQNAQAQKGAVTYVHPATRPGFQGTGAVGAKEFPVDLALGQVDALDVLSNFNEMASMELWYRALNCGFRCAISAGTDAFTNHLMGTLPGAGRVYVQVPGAFSYDRWVEQYKKGVSFATNGPSLTFTVDGKLPGDEIRVPAGSSRVSLRVKAVVDTLVPADRLEIVVNGQVVATQAAPSSGTRWEIEREVPVERSSWIAARVLGPEHRLVINDAQAFAHSSPVYCYFGNQPIWSRQDAEFFVDWIDQLIASVEQRGVFRSPDRRDNVVQLFRKAQAIYRNGPPQLER